MRDAWRRAQAWEPQFVAADLHNARELAEEYRRDAVIWRAGLDQDPVGSPERELAERDVAAAEHLAAVAAARVEALERIQDVRTDWLDRTREVQERAAFAGDELERRGLDRDTADPVGEQQELFTIGNGEPAAVADAEWLRASPATPTRLPRRRRRCVVSIPRSASSTSTGLPPRGARGHGFRAGGHRAPDHRAPDHRAPVGRRRPPASDRSDDAAAPSRRGRPRSCRDWRDRLPSSADGRAGRVCRAVRRDRTGRRTGTGAARPVRGATHARRRRGRAATAPRRLSRRRGGRPRSRHRRRADRGRGHRRGRLADRLPGHPASRDHRRDACRTRRPSRRRGGRAPPSRGRPGRRRPRPRGIPRRRRRAHRRRRRARACPPNSPADSTRRSTEPRTVGFGRR